MTDTFIAVDWGTTNRRAYRIEDGQVAATERDGLGILAVPAGAWEAQAAAIRARLGNHPMLLAGMVGSNRGWRDAGYLPCPVTLADLAANTLEVAERTRIIPGVKSLADGRGDIMRGEEVQLLGAVAAGLTPSDALLCQPGTHCKWAQMAGGAIASVATAMTGELFALLKGHALIGAAMQAAVTLGAAFDEGIARAGEHDLLTALFGVRASSLLALRDDAEAASYVSGLLIGGDVAAQVRGGETVHVLADPALGTLYARAIERVGGTAVTFDSHAAFVAGITCIWELLP